MLQYHILFKYYTILLDINECTAGTASCTQICRNTVGSYTCNCRSGYRLDGNGYTCNGKSFTEQTCLADSAYNSSYPQAIMQWHRNYLIVSDNIMQILMNVLKTVMAVLRHVLIRLEATPAPVTQAIAWQVIDMDVMVKTTNLTTNLTTNF